MSNKYSINENNNELDVTMQQKFNFESNEYEEEDTKSYLMKKKVLKSKREKELILLKNRYKKKYITTLFISFMLFLLCLIISLAYIFVKPKEKEIIKVKKEIPERVVFIGDSITWMYDLNKYYNSKNYYIVNSGINGATTQELINNLNNRIYQFEPKKLFLMIGTNDIAQNKSKKEIVNNIKSIIDEVKEKNPDCKIYLESLYPINNTDDSKINMEMVGKIRNNKLIRSINDDLEELAGSEDITYINMYDHLTDEDGNLKIEYTKEGLHLNDKGYEVITKVLKKYI